MALRWEIDYNSGVAGRFTSTQGGVQMKSKLTAGTDTSSRVKLPNTAAALEAIAMSRKVATPFNLYLYVCDMFAVTTADVAKTYGIDKGTALKYLRVSHPGA